MRIACTSFWSSSTPNESSRHERVPREMEQACQNLLAAVWLATTNRNAVTRASAAIDKALAADPRFHGHEISEGLWKIERVPLTAFYEVDDANNVVKVTKLAFNP